jgi:hypothetical protein
MQGVGHHPACGFRKDEIRLGSELPRIKAGRPGTGKGRGPLMNDMTPMIKQYLTIKSDHADAILFFRLGDFYEMFDDAKIASKILPP